MGRVSKLLAAAVLLSAPAIAAERDAEFAAAFDAFDTPVSATTPAPHAVDLDSFEPEVEQAAQPLATGNASFYGKRFTGRPTASGERFDPTALTAAHRTLPFGSKVRVTNQRTGKSVVVRINDRGPFHGNRIIDVSRAAAEQLGMVASGQVKVALHHID